MNIDDLINEIPKLSHEELITRMIASNWAFKEHQRTMQMGELAELAQECNLYKNELLNRLNHKPSARLLT